MSDAAADNPFSVERVQCFVVYLLVRGEDGCMHGRFNVNTGLQQLISGERSPEGPLRREDFGGTENLIIDHDS